MTLGPSDHVDVESAAVALMLQALVDADLDTGGGWPAIENRIVALLSATPADDVVAVVARTSTLIQQVLVEVACRPTLGRDRSQVISTVSHAVRAVVAARRADPKADLSELVALFGVETIRFGEVAIDIGAGSVQIGGRPATLTDAETRVLMRLVGGREQVVTDQELHEATWPGRPVRSQAVTAVINTLRHKLGDDAHQQHVIATAWGRGYRLVATVHLQRHSRPLQPR